jgi:hypothetical protein
MYYEHMSASRPPTNTPPRRRGAPKGNLNALKHGRYSLANRRLDAAVRFMRYAHRAGHPLSREELQPLLLNLARDFDTLDQALKDRGLQALADAGAGPQLSDLFRARAAPETKTQKIEALLASQAEEKRGKQPFSARSAPPPGRE